jgi:predicted lipoprotein with Yx(FWY)xxD motif
MTRPLAFGGALLAVGLMAAACSSNGSGPTSARADAATTHVVAVAAHVKGTVHAASASGVGTVVVNSAGRTLYLFGPDKQRKVTCTGACAQAWPPLYVKGKPVAGSGIKASLLGTIKAPNGKRQVTYNHWPLYTFSGDSKAGQANGQGLTAFGGKWFAVNTAGKRAKSVPPPTSPTTVPSPTTTAW